MPTTTQVFLSTLKEHLEFHGYHQPHACGHIIDCPKCSVLCCDPAAMPSGILNSVRMAVVAVQIRSADRLRETFVKINGTGSMFSEEELAALAIDDLHSLAYTLVDADSGVGEVGDARLDPDPAPEPPTERGRVGSGIFFPSDTVRAMMKCDCAECPNGCRDCQKKE